MSLRGRTTSLAGRVEIDDGAINIKASLGYPTRWEGPREVHQWSVVPEGEE
jgi:hypothetical protein